jgi:hypothetical protein
MKQHLVALTICLALAAGFSRSSSFSSAPPATLGFNLGDLKRELTQYHESGGYDRDVAALFSEAQSYVEQHARDSAKTAIVLDIDETSLSNWPEMRANDFGTILTGTCNSLPAGPCGVRAWEMRGEATAIQPTLKLYKSAQAHGVAVFFITGRPANELAATEGNLHAAGYDKWRSRRDCASNRWILECRRRRNSKRPRERRSPPMDIASSRISATNQATWRAATRIKHFWFRIPFIECLDLMLLTVCAGLAQQQPVTIGDIATSDTARRRQ